mmetsp:Transcript_98992/g.175412  ORF Transcript_98992/g.175412 Transcript_98992/m.175412 type:complete len:298 (-) Transcript_98992:810-1703(-)
MESGHHLVAQIQQLRDPLGPLVNVGIPLVESDLPLALVYGDCIGKEQDEGREDERGVHDRTQLAHLHCITEDHPLLAVLRHVRHHVVSVDATSEGLHLVIGVEIPIRLSAVLVKTTEGGCKPGTHRSADEGILVRAFLDRVCLTVVTVSHILAVIAGVSHEGDKLLCHHVSHLQRLRTQALFGAELLTVSAHSLSTPLAVCLQVDQVVRRKAPLVEVVFANHLSALIPFGLDRLLERVLNAEEGCNNCRGLDTTESPGDQQELRDTGLHRDGRSRPPKSRELSAVREAVHALQQAHC